MLHLLLHRTKHEFEIEVFTKPTPTYTAIHFNSNHPIEHKLAAFRFLHNRMDPLPPTPSCKQKERTQSYALRKLMDFSTHFLRNSTHTQVTHKLSLPPTNDTPLTTHKTWVTSTYHNPMMHKLPYLFRNTHLKTLYRTNKSSVTFYIPYSITLTHTYIVAFIN